MGKEEVSGKKSCGAEKKVKEKEKE